MKAVTKPAYRATVIGIAAAALLIGSFLLGSARSGAAPAARTARNGGSGAAMLAASAAGGKITVTGTGTASGTPDQLVLSMGVQTSESSVSTALRHANEAATRVIHSLRARGIRRSDIRTSGLSIQPNYRSGSQVPVSYGVSEQLTATLRDLAKAGSQIQAAVTAGGNATTVDGVSLNLTDTGPLLASARAAAVTDAQAKARQYARALGQPLGGVISLSEQNSAPYLYPVGMSAAKASVPIRPGKQQVSVHITVIYAIG